MPRTTGSRWERHEASAAFQAYPAIGDVDRHGGTRRQDHQAGVTVMPISSHEDWVQIAELDDQDQIRFTSEFRALMSDLGWEAKAFVGVTPGPLVRSVRAPAGLHQRRGNLHPGPAWPVRPQRTGRAARRGRVLGGGLEQARKLPRATSPSRLGLGLSVAWYRDVLRTSWCRSACRDGFCWSTRKRSCRESTVECYPGTKATHVGQA